MGVTISTQIDQNRSPAFRHFNMLRVILALSAFVALTSAGNTLILSQAAKDKFVDMHNSFRNSADASIPNLVWSDTLATTAAQNSDKCEFAHSDSGYGENIYLGWGSQTGSSAANGASTMWAEEMERVDEDGSWACIGTGNSDTTCGHYSQMVWRDTTEIGCAVTTGCELWGHTWTMVFCEYNPAGNMMKTWNPKVFYAAY